MRYKILLPICTFLLFFTYFVNGFNTPLQLKSERGFPKHSPKSKSNNFDSVEKKITSARFRLPLSVEPTNYNINLLPILDQLPPNPSDYKIFSSYGYVLINVKSVEASTSIVLHSSPILELNETSLSVFTLSGRRIDNGLPTRENEAEFLFLNLIEPLNVGQQYEIRAQFVAPITDDLYGFYKGYYKKPGSDELTYLASTQFQALGARRVFPCFDEPQMKATFTITIGRNESRHTTLSNSKLLSSSPIPEQAGWVWDLYEDTVKMSTYLIAFTVSDFDYTEAVVDPYRLPVRTYAAPHLIQQGGGIFAAETAAKQLTFFENYYEYDYPMHKMDSVAVPQFDAGAMENLGLNLYRPEYLLYFEGETTERSRGLVSNILAHELGHQNFGNLLTCAWWDSLWLNEGFATYVSYIGWEETHPEFEPLKFFVVDALQYSMRVDGNPSVSHPVLNDAVTPEEIDDIFDGITYEKAGSLIRMMEGFLGPEVLRIGLVRYLQEMEYKAVVQDDLWLRLNYKAQEENLLPEGGVTMKDVMDTWTLQSSYPIVRVSKFGSDRVLISQERFSPSSFRQENILNKNDLWYIPISLATEDDPDFSNHKPKLWMEPSSAMKTFSHNTSLWIMLNNDAMGYYRVLYDQPLTQMISNQLETNRLVISPQSRSQLLDDYFVFAFQEHINIETALQFTRYLGEENERIVWEAALENLEVILNGLSDTASFDAFRRYLSPKLSDALELIGLKQQPNEKGAVVLLRALLLDWANQMDLPEFILYAEELFGEWKSSPDPSNITIPVDIRPVIFCGGVRMPKGTFENFEFVFTRYENEMVAGTKLRFLRSLGCTKESNLLQSILDQILMDPSRITDTDKATALQIVAGSDLLGRGLTLTYFRENLADLLVLFNRTKEIVDVFDIMCSGAGTLTELNAMKLFVDENSALLGEEAVTEMVASLTKVEENIQWRLKYEKRLQTWFSENVEVKIKHETT